MPIVGVITDEGETVGGQGVPECPSFFFEILSTLS
jgi:hypothetical protein